jgi:hypothetical protein
MSRPRRFSALAKASSTTSSPHSGCKPPGGSERCAPSPRPRPWEADRKSHERGGRSHGDRSRERAFRPWPRTHGVAPSRVADSSGSGPHSRHPIPAAWAAAPGLGSVPQVANRLPSRQRAEAATPLAGSCRGRRPSHTCTKGDPGGFGDVGAPPGGVHRPPSAERQSASGHLG